MCAHALIADQVLQKSNERHGRRHRLLARSALDYLVRGVRGLGQWACGLSTTGQEATEGGASVEHVLDRGIVRSRVVVRGQVLVEL